jgi:hypothetical protein
MLTRYASHRELPPRRTNASAKMLVDRSRSIVEGGEGGERHSRPRLRRIPGRRRIHSPAKTVRFSIVQTRVYEVMKEKAVDDDDVFDIFSARITPLKRESKSVELTRNALLDDEDGALEALCASGSFGGW